MGIVFLHDSLLEFGHNKVAYLVLISQRVNLENEITKLSTLSWIRSMSDH